MHYTDEQLFQQAQMGSKDSFATLYNRHNKALFLYAYTLIKQESEAKDIVQDVFEDLWRRKQNIVTPTSTKAYLIQCVKNRCINKIKAHVTRGFHDLQYATMQETQCNPLNNVEKKEFQLYLNRTISLIPTQSQTALRLMFMDNLSQKEIAVTMGLKVQSVKNLVGYAVKILRKKIRSNQD